MFNAKNTKNELIQWIRDYFKYSASPETKAVIGISGGKDSSVVAALCVGALGKDRVFGVLMPNSVQDDIDVSYALCKHLDIPHTVVNIGDIVPAVYNALAAGKVELIIDDGTGTGDGMPNPVVFNNTPARIRMTVLYAVSGAIGGRVANTCNLSEDWVGYATKYGDGAGDFSPLSYLTVTEVKALGRELGLPSMFVDKTPIDGLCGKTDEDNLGFTYDTLDKYIRDGIEPDADTKARIDKMHIMNLHKLNLMPAFQLKNEKEINIV